MARSFNGSSDFIDCGHNNTFLAPIAITLSVWVNITSLANAYSAIVNRVNGGASYSILIKSTGKAAWYLGTGGGTFVDPGSITISTSTWTHLGLAYDSTNGLRAYINGVSDGTTAANLNLITTFGTADLTLGQDLNNAGRLFTGSMADFSMWSVALTAGEILALAKGARPNRIRPTLLLAWPPLEGLASPEPDLTGNANNGTLTGTALASGPPVNMLTPRWPRFLTPAVVTTTVVQRRTLDNLGTRTGSRQLRAA